MKIRYIVLCIAFAAGTALACASVPVVVGAHGDAEIDACPSLGEIAQDSYFADSPKREPALLLPIAKGTKVFLCGASPDGEWEGVVWSDEDQECGVSKPLNAPTPYAGPCKSGWVLKRAITVVAG